MKRVILAVTNDLNFDQRMQRVCRTLVAAGYAVTLVGRQLPHSLPLAQQPYQQHRLNCHFHKGKLFYIEYNLRLFLWLLRHTAHALCANDLDTILPILLAARIRRIPCLYDAHEYFTQVPEVVNRPITRKIWELVARTTIPRMDACYTVCQSLATIFQQQYHQPFACIRNVPDTPTIPTHITKPTPPVLLYQGALNVGRGLEEAITAMQQLPQCQLWIVGEGDCSQQLRQLAHTLQVSDRVQFLGYIRPQELPTITAQATIGINVLHNQGLNYYYSLANKFFDYMQAGIPSINMNFPEYAAVLNQHPVGIALHQLTPQHLAQAIQQLLTDHALYQHLRSHALQAAPQFTWAHEQQKLLALYQQTLPN
jgi:glycosyltransferase involved in cell wall biosynthesis